MMETLFLADLVVSNF